MGLFGSQDTVNITRTELPESEQQARNFLLAAAQDQFQNFTPQFFPKSTVADVSPLTVTGTEQLAEFGQSPFNQQLLGQANVNINALTGAGGFAGGLQPGVTGALNQVLGTVPGQNPLLTQLIERTLAQQAKSFREDVLPGVRNVSIASNAFGGTRGQLAEGKAISDLSELQLNTVADLMFRGFDADANRLIEAAQVGIGGIGTGLQGAASALQAAPGVQGLNLAGTENLLRAGDIDRTFRQQDLDDLIARFDFGQNLPQRQIGELTGAISGIPISGAGTVTTPGVTTGGFAGGIGGATSGLALGTQLGGTTGGIIGAILGLLAGAAGV